MAVLVPIDGGGDGEGEGGRATAVADPAPAPAPMDIDGDRGALDVLAPAPMDLDLDRDRDGGGDRAALVASTSNGGGRGGLLRDLPEDILAGTLGCLRDTSAAARTSLLSRRWRHVWKWVSGLFLHHYPAPRLQPRARRPRRPRRARGHQHQPALRHLPPSTAPRRTPPPPGSASPRPSSPESFSSATGARFRSTCFSTRYSAIPSKKEARSSSPASREPPRFGCAWGFFAYRSLPPSGVFAALRELHLVFVRFNGGELTLDDTMMPFLEGVEIWCSRGLASLTIRLKHLISMNLYAVRGVVWAQCRGAETHSSLINPSWSIFDLLYTQLI
ncbi:hypothetical protein OsJ_24651 [Oryza sativa Japonica Group]|uniref:F-box domain-containing protein n=1 Tax=Oryza sativa subsp. japonica TaxID=39947 RepID=Q8GVX3_ORYSJ|nr:hypothetical protein OsJ_24651 [Oryza sativa Japonica Group]KAF2923319.1 hypothetical protein DAI22_07g180800 [Oryza sativa Japonica Group]USI00555.1 F-box domain-containing protein [Oryza sativa Japonica Group]BAC45081.1 hypothetical protein [Oryza sativa Japonica Group]